MKTHSRGYEMSQNEFNFWQDHSAKYLEMALGTDRREAVKNPDGYGIRTGDCGDTVEMFISVNDDRIKRISFDINGCMNTAACANCVASLAEGKTIAEAWELTPEDVINYLETMPSDHTHCAELAVGAFYRALSDFREKN